MKIGLDAPQGAYLMTDGGGDGRSAEAYAQPWGGAHGEWRSALAP